MIRLPVTLLRAAALAGAAALGIAPGAFAQTSPAAQAPDPAFVAAQKAFDALPEPDRKAIQENLIWTGDFSGTGTGGFGPLTYRGIVAFQNRLKIKPDGILQPKDRAQLDAAAAQARAGVKFSRLVDARTGVRIGVPQAILDKVRPGTGGTVFASADGTTTLETMAPSGDLKALYDAAIADAPNRKITYKVLRPDWFVVSGDGEGRRFYTRVAATPAGLRGYTLRYPVARAAELDRISIAVANSFEPTPGVAAETTNPFAAAAAGGAAAVARPQAPAVAPAPPPAAPKVLGLVASGLVLAPGKVVTTAALESCAAPTVARQTVSMSGVDKAKGTAVLDATSQRPTGTLTSAGAPADGDPLVVVGFALIGADPQLSVAPGEARVLADGGLRVFAPLQRGATGSAVFDRHGGLLGIVGALSAEPRLVAGIVPQASWPVVPASALWAAAGVAAPSAAPGTTVRTAGEIAAAVRARIVAVECAR